MKHFTVVLAFCAVFATSSSYAKAVGDQTLSEPADRGQFPYFVFLKHEGYDHAICGGAIIGSKYILTKGSCLHMGAFSVMVGCVEYNSIYCEAYEVYETHNHPDYDWLGYVDNIGVIVLDRDIWLNEYASIIPLSPMEIEDNTGMTGLGMDYFGSYMEWTSLTTTSLNDCLSKWPLANSYQSLCTLPGTYALDGTFGSPIEYMGHMIGIAMESNNNHDIILRVEPYLKFIYDIIQ